jgi:Flp pilus assembly protein TadG
MMTVHITARQSAMLLQRFFEDRRASVVPFFALSFIPLLGLVGAAVDYSRAAAVRTAIQSAADSTALALSKTVVGMDSAQVQASASTFFTAVFSQSNAQNVTVAANYSGANGSTLVVTGSATVKTLFMGVMGFPELPVSATGTAVWGTTRLRIALALDNTGSMAQSGKLDALKTATKNLLAQLKAAATKDGDVYVSIVPFAKDVNVGSSNRDQPWIDWSDWDAANGSCSKSWDSTKSACTNDKGTWTSAARTSWNGCVTDRTQNYDTMNTTPTSGGTLFPAEQYSSCSAALTSLSYDWTTLNTKVDGLKAVGNTNITIGLQWGWQSLTEGLPLSAPAEDSNYKYEKVIILLTDGQNTQNRWNSDQSSIDIRTRKACDNVKAAGVKIYTVLVMDGNKSLLQSCATDSSKYFYLTSAAQIITTFDTIGTNLTRLRLAK